MQIPERVHIIGIGGIGISALARLLVHAGKVVSGTNDSESRETLDGLRDQGVVISLGLTPSDLPEADCYIYSDAWESNHPEIMAEARTRGVPVWSYFEALGEITKSYKLIAVAGAHGKTTTTAMMTDVLEAGGLDPTAIVGSLRAKTRSNFRAGQSEYFVVEADEYRRHFLNFSPYMLVITNIEADHLDYYKDLSDIQSAFRELALRVPRDGFVICDAGHQNVMPVIAGLSCAVVDYRTYLDPELPLKVLPLHRINAAAVLAAADKLGILPDVARNALSEFSGTWRRFEYKGKTKNGADIYDDYAHHPTEIETTLKSVREEFGKERRVIVAFHPHLFSRTKAFLEEFSAAFHDADEVVVMSIFAAREKPDPAISNEVLAQKILARGTHARALSSFEEIAAYINSIAKEGDLIITMGAGDIYKVAEAITA